ncbi:MAG TPA: thioesterase family protein [Thermoanaerobaculia bacterium]|nr:thioesterase family protein [Thermoanaerobaculia bacterium]
MFEPFADGGLNPKFTFHSPVQLHELDAAGMLPSSRFTSHVESAIAAWYNVSGRGSAFGDLHVVRDIHIEFLNPMTGPALMRIDVWVDELDETSCVYGFICSSADGRVAYARGDRTILNLDAQSHRPAAWSMPFRARHEALRKDLPSLA